MCIERKSDDGQAEGKAKRAAAQREDDMTGVGTPLHVIETAMGILLPQTKTYLRLSAARGGKKAPFPRVTGKHVLRSLYCRLMDSRTMEGKYYSAPPCVVPCHSSPRR